MTLPQKKIPDLGCGLPTPCSLPIRPDPLATSCPCLDPILVNQQTVCTLVKSGERIPTPIYGPLDIQRRDPETGKQAELGF